MKFYENETTLEHGQNRQYTHLVGSNLTIKQLNDILWVVMKSDNYFYWHYYLLLLSVARKARFLSGVSPENDYIFRLKHISMSEWRIIIFLWHFDYPIKIYHSYVHTWEILIEIIYFHWSFAILCVASIEEIDIPSDLK